MIDESLVDEMVGAYVTWRGERAAVWDAYARWGEVLDDRTFGAYRRALDREEDAAHAYSAVLARISAPARGSRTWPLLADRDTRSWLSALAVVVTPLVLLVLSGVVTELVGRWGPP